MESQVTGSGCPKKALLYGSPWKPRVLKISEFKPFLLIAISAQHRGSTRIGLATQLYQLTFLYKYIYLHLAVHCRARLRWDGKGGSSMWSKPCALGSDNFYPTLASSLGLSPDPTCSNFFPPSFPVWTTFRSSSGGSSHGATYFKVVSVKHF